MSVWCKGYDTKSDAMDWMLTHQLSSKNLTVNERMAMVNDFKEEVRIENEKKKKESDKLFYGNQYNKVDSTPNGVNSKAHEKSKTHSDTWTDSQTAKKVELHQIWWKSRIIAQIMKQIQNSQN